MKKILFVVIGLLMAMNVHAVDLRDAEVALSKGQMERAAEIATMALNDNPKSGRAHMIRAYAFGKQGYVMSAQKELMLAEQLDQNGTVVRSPLAKKVYELLPEHKALTVSAAPTQELRSILPASEHENASVKFTEGLQPVSVPAPNTFGVATATPPPEDKTLHYVFIAVVLGVFAVVAACYYVRYLDAKEKANVPQRRHTDPQGEDFVNDPVQRVLRRTTESGTPTYETRSNRTEVHHHHHDNNQQSGMSAAAAGLTGLVAGGAIGAVAASAMAHSSHDHHQEKLEAELEETRRKDRQRREEEQASFSSGVDSDVPIQPARVDSYSPSRDSEKTSRTYDAPSQDFGSGSDSGGFESGSD